MVCKDCHRYIHNQFSEKQLGRDLNSLELLQQEEKMKQFIRWVRKKR